MQCIQDQEIYLSKKTNAYKLHRRVCRLNDFSELAYKTACPCRKVCLFNVRSRLLKYEKTGVVENSGASDAAIQKKYNTQRDIDLEQPNNTASVRIQADFPEACTFLVS